MLISMWCFFVVVVFHNLAEASDKIIHGTDHSIQAEVVYIGAGIGGGIVIAVLFVMIALVLVCWRRSRKIQRR